MSAAATPLLELQGLGKRYAQSAVLRDCHLDIAAGEIRALLGANGAGKSTLVRIVAGLIQPSSGSMRLGGQAYQPMTKRDAETSGVEIVQQELNLIPTLSVAENLMLTRLPAIAGVIRFKRLHARAQEALARLGLKSVSPDTTVGSLGIGQQQMIEIAAALDRRCRLLILDEPTAALSVAESETLFERLEELREDGVAIIYISHRLDEVTRLADRITVLRDGQHVGTFPTSECSSDRMVGLMVGDSVSATTPAASATPQSNIALRVDKLAGGIVKESSFEVHQGEIFGIAGLVGSGRTELLRLIFGADVAKSGCVSLGGTDSPQRFRHPSQSVAAGLAMITEDRKHNGLLLSKSIWFNSTLASLRQRFSMFGGIRHRVEREAVTRQQAALEIRSQSIDQPVATLSGGNQQKVAIAKWLVRGADVFLFDEPTRGIDVAARHNIYRLMHQLAAQGKAIVMVSSDLEELLELCDRVGVMSNGQLVETFTRGSWSREEIMQATFSGYLDGRPR